MKNILLSCIIIILNFQDFVDILKLWIDYFITITHYFGLWNA